MPELRGVTLLLLLPLPLPLLLLPVFPLPVCFLSVSAGGVALRWRLFPDAHIARSKALDADPGGTGLAAADAHSAPRRRAAHIHERERVSIAETCIDDAPPAPN